MRVTGNSRSCTIALDVYEDKNKIITLELENSKVKVEFFLFTIFLLQF